MKKSKRLWLLLLSVLLLLTLTVGLTRWDLWEPLPPKAQSVDVPHVYPDVTTREFKALSNKRNLLRVSEGEARSLTTRALIITIITYPYFPDEWLAWDPNYSMLYELGERCNLSELTSRPGWEDALEAQRLLYLEEGQTEYVERIESLQRSWNAFHSNPNIQ